MAGTIWGVGYYGLSDPTKQAYHAFVLLAASNAKVAGHPPADRLLNYLNDHTGAVLGSELDPGFRTIG